MSTAAVVAMVYGIVYALKPIWTQEDNEAFLIASGILLGYNLTRVIVHDLWNRRKGARHGLE